MTFRKILFLVLCISVFFTSCEKSTDSLSDAIPADANYVIHFDNKALIEKSKYDIFKNATVQQAVNMSKAMLGDEAKIKIVDDFLKDANSLGLNLKNDLYIYTNYKVYGIVLGVNDASKLKNNIISLSRMPESTIKSEGDIHYISPESRVVIAWNKSKLVLIADIASYSGLMENATPVSMEELAKTQLTQSADKSISSDKSYAEFSKNKKDISVFYNMKGLDKLPALYGFSGPQLEAMKPVQKLLGDLEGVTVGMYTSFEKGEIKLTSQMYYENAEAEKKYKDLVAKMSGTLKGDQLKFAPQNPLFVVSANLKGEGIYSYLKDLGIVNMMEKEMSDSTKTEVIEQIVKQFNGDITIIIASVKKDGYKTIPELAAFADVTDTTTIMKLFREELSKSYKEIKEISPAVFMVEEDDMKVYFGVNKQTLFATNLESVYNNLNSTDLKNEYASVAKDKSSLMAGDLQALKPLMEGGGKEMAQALLILNELGKYEFTTSATDFTGDGQLEFVTKDKNSLEVLCLKVEQIITNMGSMFGR